MKAIEFASNGNITDEFRRPNSKPNFESCLCVDSVHVALHYVFDAEMSITGITHEIIGLCDGSCKLNLELNKEFEKSLAKDIVKFLSNKKGGD